MRTTQQTPRQILGRNIKAARLAKEWTQTELAAEIGVRESQTISNWERGQNAPHGDNLAALASVLGHDIGWFYTDHDEEALAA